MNKRFTIAIVFMMALTLSVAALMIGCNNEKDKPTGEPGNTHTFDIQTTDGTTNTDDTDETTDDEQLQTDATLPAGVDVSMGVVEGAGSTDLEDDPKRPTASQITETTKPVQTTKPTQPPEQTPEEILGKDFDIDELDWETYHGMRPEKQKAVIALFSTPEDFVKWHKAALAQYKAEHPDVEIGEDGFVDLNP